MAANSFNAEAAPTAEITKTSSGSISVCIITTQQILHKMLKKVRFLTRDFEKAYIVVNFLSYVMIIIWNSLRIEAQKIVIS